MEPEIKYKPIDLQFHNYISKSETVLLPHNWSVENEVDHIYSENTVTISKLFKINNIPVSIYGFKEDSKITNNRNIEWVSPIIFLSAALISNNPEISSLAISILANYLTDLFRGNNNSPNVKISLYFENSKGEIKEASYSGPTSGLHKFKQSIEEFSKIK